MSRCVTLAAEIVAAGRRTLEAEAGRTRVRAALEARPCRARVVLAVGKASWSMALGAADVLGAGVTGLVVARDAPPEALPDGLALMLAGHPRPDARSVDATRAALALAAGLGADDELLVLLSGGTSALIGGPVDGFSLEDVAALTERLLRGGVPIEAINRVRRRLGAALGGRLAAATRARVRVLALSDIASDDLAVIGSGPLSPPPADDDEAAIAVCAAAGVDASLVDRLRGLVPAAALAATIDPRRVDAAVLAGPRTLAATGTLRVYAAGYVVRSRPPLLAGPVEALAARLVDEARTLAPGEAFVAAGEPTVTVRGDGLGGRAQHAALLALDGLAALGDRALLALGSDGSDGPTDAAGAIVTSDSAAQARAAGIDLAAAIGAFDSHPALDALGALVRTGPTGTNLADLYVVARAR